MNIRILITILHDLIFFGVSFFVSLWIRLDLDSALILCKELWWFLIFFRSLIFSYLSIWVFIMGFGGMRPFMK